MPQEQFVSTSAGALGGSTSRFTTPVQNVHLPETRHQHLRETDAASSSSTRSPASGDLISPLKARSPGHTSDSVRRENHREDLLASAPQTEAAVWWPSTTGDVWRHEPSSAPATNSQAGSASVTNKRFLCCRRAGGVDGDVVVSVSGARRYRASTGRGGGPMYPLSEPTPRGVRHTRCRSVPPHLPSGPPSAGRDDGRCRRSRFQGVLTYHPRAT